MNFVDLLYRLSKDRKDLTVLVTTAYDGRSRTLLGVVQSPSNGNGHRRGRAAQLLARELVAPGVSTSSFSAKAEQFLGVQPRLRLDDDVARILISAKRWSKIGTRRPIRRLLRRSIDISALTSRKGEIFGFLGANGAGKTTTIRVALWLADVPTAGLSESSAGIDVSCQGPERHHQIQSRLHVPKIHALQR